MRFLLDTNILSAQIRQPAQYAHRFIQYTGRLYSSSISIAELYVWAYRRSDPDEGLMAIDCMLNYQAGVVNFDTVCGNTFGKVRVNLRKHGIEVNTVDLMIASTALTHDLVLVTHNTSDFNRIPGLVLEDWLR